MFASFSRFSPILLILFVTLSSAKTYFIATNGDDNISEAQGGGTIGKPFKSFAPKAWSYSPGDTVYFRAGEHVHSTWMSRSGTAQNWVVFRPYQNEKVILKGGGIDKDLFAIGNGGGYIDISGFEITGPSNIAVNLWGGKNVRVTKCVIHGCQRGALYTGNGGGPCYFANNRVYNNVLMNADRSISGSAGWPSAVNLDGVGSVAVNNVIYENFGEGIGFYGSRTYAADNVVYDNYSVQIYISGATDGRLERNFVYNTHDPRFYRDLYGTNGPAFGIAVSNETSDRVTANDTIVNNIVVGGNMSFFFWKAKGGGGLDRFYIANNVFHQADGAVLHVDPGTHAETVFRNNIFVQVRTAKNCLVTNWGVTHISPELHWDYNCWFGDSIPAGVKGTGDVYVDPLFAGTPGITVTGFALIPGSPCRNHGAAVPFLDEDYTGRSRPQEGVFDIGAFEFGGATGIRAVSHSAQNASRWVSPRCFDLSGRRTSIGPVLISGSGAQNATLNLSRGFVNSRITRPSALR